MLEDKGMKEMSPGMRPIMVEVISIMLAIQTDECKNCHRIFESIGMKKKFADQEINEYPEDIKEEVLRLSNWIREQFTSIPTRFSSR